MTSRPARHERPGFTLIEAVAVVLILGLMAGAAVVSMKGALRRAKLGEVLTQVRDYDHTARLEARRFGRPVVLVYQPHSVWRRAAGESAGGAPRRRAKRGPLRLPEGFSLASGGAGGAGVTGGGSRRVRITRDGRSRSFLLAVTAANGRRALVLFAGLSGQSMVLRHEPEAKQIAALLGRSRLDAD